LVIGFGGAKPKHVAKYAQLYQNKGCSTVAGTASNQDIFTNPTGPGIDAFAGNAVREVANLLREEDDPINPNSLSSKGETPIVMHIISNGGAFVARKIGHKLDIVHQQETREAMEGGTNRQDTLLFAKRLKLGCQVFDSAPCYPGIKGGFNVIKHLIPNAFIGIPAAVLFVLTTHIIPKAISFLTRKPTRGEQFWDALLEDKNCGRQAFIYAENDDISNAKKIEEFMIEREKRGVHVMAKHFDDSVHVQHIRLHEIEYSEFIDDVLTNMEGMNISQSS
jgi:hypothetical protein